MIAKRKKNKKSKPLRAWGLNFKVRYTFFSSTYQEKIQHKQEAQLQLKSF